MRVVLIAVFMIAVGYAKPPCTTYSLNSVQDDCTQVSDSTRIKSDSIEVKPHQIEVKKVVVTQLDTITQEVVHEIPVYKKVVHEIPEYRTIYKTREVEYPSYKQSKYVKVEGGVIATMEYGWLEIPSVNDNESYSTISFDLKAQGISGDGALFYTHFRKYFVSNYSLFSLGVGVGFCGERVCGAFGADGVRQDGYWGMGMPIYISYRLTSHIDLNVSINIIDWATSATYDELMDDYEYDTKWVTDLRGGIGYAW